VQSAIEDAVRKAAPEIAAIDVAGVVEEEPRVGNLLQIGGLGANSGTPPQTARQEWATVPRPEIVAGEVRPLDVDGLSVLICSLEDDLYAYRNSCASCGSLLDQSHLEAEQLTCAVCGQAYNVRLAGRSIQGATLHLQPLPLLQQNGSLRIATSSVPR
jgi:nitrite reductase/ring-hydroxylating ferredoxin subunit